MAASSSSSFSSSSVTIDGFTYDVFLSFRGEDTRHGFTGNLWKALHDRGIKTFIDDEEIRKGEEITKSLLEAIEQSRMAIVVLSQNYATSSFCLDELSHILDCIRGKGRLVWPVFYEVDPSDVRNLKRTYGEAMDLHEARSNDNMDRLHKWKNALHQVANLSGTHYKWRNGGGYDYKFIEEIVKEVSREIKPFTLYVTDYLVGLEPQKQDVISLLNVGSTDEVHMVGIYGIGGVGKTTLALAVYNSIAHQFKGLCFLESVRENSEKHGLTYLQKIILSEIVREKGIELTSVRQGISIIQQRLRQKKVLLILDDVDKLEQLVAIVGEPKWFGPGSRVIITTRDKGLLTSHGVKSTYGMKELNEKDALKLLRWKAFKTDDVSSIYADVLNRAATYTSGLPLALEVIGSHLFEKGIEEWEYAVDQYAKFPDKKIQKVLEASFNTLEVEEKSAFLDIACCFKGYELTEVEKILHAHHGDRTKAHIRVLVQKCLIKISESGNVTIHDLIEDMGKEIVRRESPEEPGKRSRLWYPKDIIQVLKENTGTSKNEIIYLNSEIEVECDGEAFKKMENLKTLIIRCRRFSEYPRHLPSSLRVLQWHFTIRRIYPSSSSHDMLFDSHPKKLVICEINCGYPPSTVYKNLFKKKFENMKVLKINWCSLTHIGDVSGLTNLEEISFSHWEYLTTIDDSFGLLDKLKILYVGNCYRLTSFPPLMLPSLKELHISLCYSLLSIPLLKWPSLEVLNISHCDSLLSIPLAEDESLGKLKVLSVKACTKLTSIPPLKFPSLEKLHLTTLDSLGSIPLVGDGSLGDCQKHRSFPLLKFLPLKLPSLVELYISYCNTLESISSIDELDKLKILSITCCSKLKSIPPLKLPSLVSLSIICSLESIPPMDGSLGKLKFLSVKRCRKLKSIPPLKLPSLEVLDLSFCDSLESIAPLKLPSLEELDLSYCYSLESILPMDGLLGKLKRLRVECCLKLRSIPPLTLPSLEELNLSQCGSLESIASMDMSMGKLKFLSLKGCRKLTSIPPLELPLLEHLQLSRCDHLKSFPEILGVMKNITKFNMDHTPIKKFPFSFQNLTRLQTLELKHCGNVQLPSSIVVMSELTTITMMFGGWLFSKQDMGEEKGSPMQSSQVEFLRLENCSLSNESLVIGLKWFANVKELNLSSSNFTILPKCIEQCQFLWKLDLDYCEELQEIKGIPPSLKTLSAVDCKSLASSCIRKLLTQELHEVGNTDFLLPRATVPEWFDHHCRSGMSFSFWFRNKFPAVALCDVSSLRSYYSHPDPFRVIINGNTFFYTDFEHDFGRSNLKDRHLHLFHMQMKKFDEKIETAIFSENKWNHAKIVFGFHVTASGIHVLKEQEEDDVKFTRP